MTLSVLDAAREVPDHTAVITAAGLVTFSELATRVRRCLQYLQQRERLVEHPRAVAVVAHPEIGVLELLYSLIEIGAPVYLLHARLPPEAVRSRAGAVGLPLVSPPPPAFSGRWDDVSPGVEAARPLAIVETSGSTGKHQAIVLSRRAFCVAATASESNLSWRSDDRWLLALPPAHVGGLSIVTRCLLARRPLVIGRGSDPALMSDDIVRHRITLASVVPTQLARLIAARHSCPPHVRALLVGGAPLADALRSAATARGWPILTTYGLTEACSQVATQRPGSPARGVGQVLAPLQVRVVDSVIEIRGPSLCSGCLAAQAVVDRHGLRIAPATLEDGWLRTSDRGSLDPDGTLHVHGRADNVIISGGEKVDPLRVESALAALDEVIEAGVIGVPCKEWGSCVTAAVVAHPDTTSVQLQTKLHTALAPHEVPRRIHFLDALPRTWSGKLDRRRLAAEIESLAPASR
jgi:O-succinylbenzoic acid--CoA ligase